MNITLDDIIKFYNIKLNKSNKSICQFHKDTNPSMSFNFDKQIIKCFVCFDKAVNPIGFVMKKENLDYKQAVNFINENILKIKNRKTIIKKKIKPKTNKIIIKEYFNEFENILISCWQIVSKVYRGASKLKNFNLMIVYYRLEKELIDIETKLNYLTFQLNKTKKFLKNYFFDLFDLLNKQYLKMKKFYTRLVNCEY